MTSIPLGSPPILRDKHYDSPSTFTPESLLREARRQKDVPHAPIPKVCVLDPDGDIVSSDVRVVGSPLVALTSKP